MSDSTIAMLRAYLATASLAAAAIQAAALVSVVFFGVSEEVFTSLAFHIASAAAIVGIVLFIKQIARVAFVSALSRHYATVADAHSNATSVSSVCPVRMLVILHLRFNRRPLQWESG